MIGPSQSFGNHKLILEVRLNLTFAIVAVASISKALGLHRGEHDSTCYKANKKKREGAHGGDIYVEYLYDKLRGTMEFSILGFFRWVHSASSVASSLGYQKRGESFTCTRSSYDK
jgi:hypothetical protein